MADRKAGLAGEILHARLLEWMQHELARDRGDEAGALRKALLALLYTADPKSTALQTFATYLLSDFAPVAAHFEDEMHPFIGDQQARRWESQDKTELLLHRDLTDAIMAADIRPDEVVRCGLTWPWETHDHRLVGRFHLVGWDQLDDKEAVIEALRESAFTGEKLRQKDPNEPFSYEGCWIRFIMMDDTILLATRDASQDSEMAIFLGAGSLFTTAARYGVGVKGAIARGEITVDFESVLISGGALSVASRLATQQLWFGVIMDQSVSGKLGKALLQPPANDVSEDYGGWLPLTGLYQVPMSGAQGSETHSALNWPMLYRSDPDSLIELLDPLRHLEGLAPEHHFHALRFGEEMLRRMELMS